MPADNHHYYLNVYCFVFFICSHIFSTLIRKCTYQFCILQKSNHNIIQFYFLFFLNNIHTLVYFICLIIDLHGNFNGNIIFHRKLRSHCHRCGKGERAYLLPWFSLCFYSRNLQHPFHIFYLCLAFGQLALLDLFDKTYYRVT